MLINILKAKVTDMQNRYMQFKNEHAIDLMFIWFVMYQQPVLIYLNLRFWLWFCLCLRKLRENEKVKKIIGWSFFWFLYSAPFLLLFYFICYAFIKYSKFTF